MQKPENEASNRFASTEPCTGFLAIAALRRERARFAVLESAVGIPMRFQRSRDIRRYDGPFPGEVEANECEKLKFSKAFAMKRDRDAANCHCISWHFIRDRRKNFQASTEKK